MKFCMTCKGSGRVLVASTSSTYSKSIDYYPQKCSKCEGKGYIEEKNNK